jgi:membrane fusion protein
MRVKELPLFREQAVKRKRAVWHGTVIMTQPVSTQVATAVAVVLAALLTGFMTWGSYTERVTVPGQIVPSAGVAKLYVPEPGVVVEERLYEGQRVKKGDLLFLISRERQTGAMEAVRSDISAKERIQLQVLREELQKTERLLSMDEAALREKIGAMRLDIPKLMELIVDQRDRVEIADQSLTRYQQLSKDGYVSYEQLIQRKADSIEQRTRLASLERERISAQSNLRDAEAQLRALPLKYAPQIGELNRSIAASGQRLTETELQRQFVIVATEAGTVSAVTARRGQWVDSSTPLASIVPIGARWVAELYAPSRAVGFVQPGDIAHIRFQAFPYQRFGQRRAKILSVAAAPLSRSELTRSNSFDTVAATEPLYRIVADIDLVGAAPLGPSQALRAGMLVEADIMQEKRRMYEWALQPLQSLSRRL